MNRMVRVKSNLAVRRGEIMDGEDRAKVFLSVASHARRELS